MKRLWIIALVALVLAASLLIPRFYLLPQLTQGIQGELAGVFQTQEVQVELTAPWGWEPLFGRVPHLKITMEGANLGGLRASAVEIQGKDVRFDQKTLWQNRDFVYKSSSFLEAQINIAEKDLNELFWKEVDPDQNLNLEINPQGISLGGILAFWNMEWEVRLHGLLEVVQGTTLRFVPQNLEVHETRVPPFLLEVFNENYDFVVELGMFPYPLEITAIQFSNEQIMLKMGVVE